MGSRTTPYGFSMAAATSARHRTGHSSHDGHKARLVFFDAETQAAIGAYLEARADNLRPLWLERSPVRSGGTCRLSGSDHPDHHQSSTGADPPDSESWRLWDQRTRPDATPAVGMNAMGRAVRLSARSHASGDVDLCATGTDSCVVELFEHLDEPGRRIELPAIHVVDGGPWPTVMAVVIALTHGEQANEPVIPTPVVGGVRARTPGVIDRVHAPRDVVNEEHTHEPAPDQDTGTTSAPDRGPG